MAQNETVLDDGALKFSVETRLLRELGERLVKQPEVALVELIKNAYDADAIECQVECGSRRIRIDDDGLGMTLDRFENAWMRIGTSSKVDTPLSERFDREITGEKGIGRFAVRFPRRRASSGFCRVRRFAKHANSPDRGLRLAAVRPK